MTALPVFGGALKRDIVKRAYGLCGQASCEFELEPEEMNAGVQALNDAMAELNVTAYNFPITGDGNGNEESGLTGPDVLGASVMVAKMLAPQIGKTLALNATHYRAEQAMIARYRVTPTMGLGRNTIAGAGNRYNCWLGPFLPTDINQTDNTLTSDGQIVVVTQ